MMVKCRKKRPAPVAAEQVKESKAQEVSSVLYVTIGLDKMRRNATTRKNTSADRNCRHRIEPLRSVV